MYIYLNSRYKSIFHGHFYGNLVKYENINTQYILTLDNSHLEDKMLNCNNVYWCRHNRVFLPHHRRNILFHYVLRLDGKINIINLS